MNARTFEAPPRADSTYLQLLHTAMREFREFGRSTFLAKHKLDRSAQWFIDDGQHYYDADAIAAVAQGLQDGTESTAHSRLQREATAQLPETLSKVGLTIVDNPYRCLVLATNERHARPEFDKWQDVTGERYHFPNTYRNRIRPGREFVYYRGGRRKDGSRATPAYFGFGRIGEVYPDVTTTGNPQSQWHWLCDIEDYHEFASALPFKDERGLYIELNTAVPPRRYWETGVRLICDRTYQQILSAAGVTLKSPPALAPAPPVVDLIVSDEPLTLLVKPSTTRPNGAPGGGRGSRHSKRAKEIGDLGERLFLERLRNQALSAADREQIVWVANLGQTPGWDVEDRRHAQPLVYEIKATNGSKFPTVDITANEWSAAARLRERYNLVLIVQCESANPKIEVVNDPWRLVEQQLLHAEPVLFRLARQ